MVSNFPEGCRESDIPGSRPEDIAQERLFEEFCSLFKHYGPVLDQPTIQELLQQAINFGIEKGKENQLHIFTEKRFYQTEYMEDRFSSILRMLYWRLPSSVNFYFVCEEQVECIVT